MDNCQRAPCFQPYQEKAFHFSNVTIWAKEAKNTTACLQRTRDRLSEIPHVLRKLSLRQQQSYVEFSPMQLLPRPPFFPPWWCGSGRAGGLKASLPDAVTHLLPRKASAPAPARAERLRKAKASSARNEATQRNQPPAEAATQDSPRHAP